jgi:hypothetical protein
LDIEFSALKKADSEEKAKRQEAEQKAEAKKQEYQKELDRLNRQRSADESAAEYAAWQRRQTQTVNQLERESTRLQSAAGMAAVRSDEASDRLQSFQRRNPNVQPRSESANTPAAAAPPSMPRNQIPTDPQGNAYQQAVQARGFGDSGGRVFDTSRTTSGAPPVVIVPNRSNDPLPSRLAPVQSQPVIENTPRDRRILTDPGGVIIASTAEIAGLKTSEVASASFDTAQGILTLALRSGKNITCKLDPDDFAVAVRSVFDRQVDPALSMTYNPDKPGFFAVDYTGPLFKTKFGKLMYGIDEMLGDILFNREGDHRAPASAVIPPALVFEADSTMTIGSRVFLLAGTASFVVENDRLICRKVESKVQVTATDYAADYFQEPLHRLARVMDEQFDALVEKFTEFKEFRRLAECIALAKWLKRNSIAFDWSALKTFTLAEHDFPAYVPASGWNRLFNGRNLDGWRINLSSGQLESKLNDTHLSLKPMGSETLQLRSSTWAKGYDIRYVVQTDGPVELIVRDGSVGSSASVAVDTKGKRHALEVFVRDGKWSAVGPGFDKSGELSIPQSKAGEPTITNDFGMRVPPGSTVMLYAAAMRRW